MHFSHNKNGKVTMGAGAADVVPGSQNGEDVVVGIKPPKVPKTKKKSEDKLAKANTSSIQQYDNSQSSFGYEMQSYGDPNNPMSNYNNCVDHSNPHSQPPHHPHIQQHHPQHMPIPNDPNSMGMYGYSEAMQPNAPPSTQNTNDFTNQYYLQENAVSWDNMQLYNNGAMSNDNMSYPVGVNNDYMHVPPNMESGMAPTKAPNVPQDPTTMMSGMPPHQDMYGYRHQDPHQHTPNMWNVNQNQNSSYNSIGNILTNLELIGNNSNFENSFDIVTSQVENNQQPYPDHNVIQQQQQQHQHPHPHPHTPNMWNANQNNMQYHDHQQQAQYHHHINYGEMSHNHTITDISQRTNERL